MYLTKAERYDLLAQLMGFEPQVDYQKALRRVQKELRRKFDFEASRLEEASGAPSGAFSELPRALWSRGRDRLQ